MGQLIKINRKLKQPVFVSTVKGFGQFTSVTCQMDGWLCVVVCVPGSQLMAP